MTLKKILAPVLLVLAALLTVGGTQVAVAPTAGATLGVTSFETGSWRAYTTSYDTNLASFTVENVGTVSKPQYYLKGYRANGNYFGRVPVIADTRYPDGTVLYRAYFSWTTGTQVTSEQFVYFIRRYSDLEVTDVVRFPGRNDSLKRSSFYRTA